MQNANKLLTNENLKLWNTTKNIKVVDHIEKAETLFARTKGLLGRNFLDQNQTLWIADCSSIHTLFMKFSIDVVFVDRDFKVRACYKDVNPWRLILPVRKAKSVFEFAAGTIGHNIEIGDQLNVGC
ncbi:MAG: DUF192 domain-containing protein [Bdellovibrionales bacterium]